MATKFVESKNPRHALDELKVNLKDPKRPATPSGGTPRSNTPALRDRNGNRPMTRSASRDQLNQDGNPPFYATDASGLSQRSTVGTIQKEQHRTSHSAPRTHAQDTQRQQRDAQAEQDQYEEIFQEEEVTDNGTDDEDGDVPSDPLQQSSKIKIKRHQNAQANGHGLGRIDGDSYPETTSGRPSVADAGHYQGQHGTQSATQGTEQIRATLPTRGGGTRVPGQALNTTPREQQQRPSTSYQAPTPSSSAMPFLGGSKNPADLVNTMDTGFQWGAAPGAKMNMSRPNGAQQYQPSNKQQPRAEIRHTVPSQAQATEHQGGRQSVSQQQERRQPVHEQRAPQAESELMPPPQTIHRRASPDVPVHQQNEHLPHMGDEQAIDHPQSFVDDQHSDLPGPRQSSPPQAYGHPAFEQPPFQQPQTEDRVILDFEPEQLYRMEYDELKAADFDTDPHSQGLQLGEEHESSTLQEKLAIVGKLHPEVQQSFFAGLNIEQWEDAGDWFVQRFGEALQKFKTIRRERRQVGRDFEDQVAKRHAAVSKKRKFTQDALNEMKESGGKVLQGTPSKARKTK